MNAIPTIKIYYTDTGCRKATARITKIEESIVVTDRTIFYPEGGGQVGDVGHLGSFAVRDTKKRGGQVVVQAGLPMVAVQTEITHILETNVSDTLAVGDEVELTVNSTHRAGCTRHHGATHLVLCKVWELFGKATYLTQGCLIGPTEARLDLFTETEQKFTPGLLADIEGGVNAWIDANLSVQMMPVPDIDEMFIWSCDDSQILSMPCGGTHASALGEIGHVRLKRRSKGVKNERIYINVTETSK